MAVEEGFEPPSTCASFLQVYHLASALSRRDSVFANSTTQHKLLVFPSSQPIKGGNSPQALQLLYYPYCNGVEQTSSDLVPLDFQSSAITISATAPFASLS